MTYNVFSGTLNPTHFTSPKAVLHHLLLTASRIASLKHADRFGQHEVVALKVI